MDSLQKQLRQKAHHLQPVVLLGNAGLSKSVHQEIDCALTAHELIKIKLNTNDSADKAAWIERICAQHQANLIQKIGHTIVIYRKNPDNDE